MTVDVFLLRSQFRVSPPQLFEQKYRVVPKSASPTGLFRDHAVCQIRDHGNRSSRLRHGRHANKSRPPFRTSLIAHFAQQFPHAICIGSARPRVSRRMNSRRATQCWYYQPGIIRQHCLIREPAVMQRLPRGIFSKCRSRLLEGRELAKTRQQFNRNARPARQLHVLAQFSSIRRRQKQSHEWTIRKGGASVHPEILVVPGSESPPPLTARRRALAPEAAFPRVAANLYNGSRRRVPRYLLRATNLICNNSCCAFTNCRIPPAANFSKSCSSTSV